MAPPTHPIAVELPSLPAFLPGLTPREAVVDALYRAQHALDTQDEALLDSAVARDLHLEFPGRHVTRGLAAFKAEIFSHLAGDLDTAHALTNVRVHLADERATTAQVSCLATSQHVPKGEGLEPAGRKFLTGSLYWLELVRDGVEGEGEGDEAAKGMWKIKTWKARFVWAEGDPKVMPEEI